MLVSYSRARKTGTSTIPHSLISGPQRYSLVFETVYIFLIKIKVLTYLCSRHEKVLCLVKKVNMLTCIAIGLNITLFLTKNK